MFVLYSYDCSAHESVMKTLKLIGCSEDREKLQEQKEALEEYCRLENSMINTYRVKYWALCNNMTQTRYEKFPVVRGLTWTEWQQRNREKAYKHLIDKYGKTASERFPTFESLNDFDLRFVFVIKEVEEI